MSVLGMDPYAVRQLAARFGGSADEIRSLMTELSAAIHDVAWQGPDRDKFVQSWDGQHAQQLRRVVEALVEAADSARSNATQQERTSSGF